MEILSMRATSALHCNETLFPLILNIIMPSERGDDSRQILEIQQQIYIITSSSI